MTKEAPFAGHNPRDLPASPAVPGLRFRHYAGDADLQPIVDVILASYQASDYSSHTTVEKERHSFANLTHMDPARDITLAMVGDHVVAMSRVDWYETLHNERFYRSLGHVHPEWQHRGIGAAMLTHNERRLRHLATAHEFEGKKVFVTWFPDGDEGACSLFRQRGYEPERTYSQMVRPSLEDIIAPPMPAGLEVRPIRREQLRMVWDAMVESFQDHGGEFDWSDQAFTRWSGHPLTDPGLFVFAFDGDQLAGGGQDMIDPEENEAHGYRRGWLERGFIRRPWRSWRGRGLAGAMIPRLLLALRDRDMTSAQLRVDTASPFNSERLYRKFGFEVVCSASEWHKTLGD